MQQNCLVLQDYGGAFILQADNLNSVLWVLSAPVSTHLLRLPNHKTTSSCL